MSKLAKVLHTAKTRTTGGQENGVSRSSDRAFERRLDIPLGNVGIVSLSVGFGVV